MFGQIVCKILWRSNCLEKNFEPSNDGRDCKSNKCVRLEIEHVKLWKIVAAWASCVKDWKIFVFNMGRRSNDQVNCVYPANPLVRYCA